MKNITEEQIEEIVDLINTHRTLSVKKRLKELPDCKEEEIIKKLKRIIMNSGRSNLVATSEIEQILVDIGG